MHFALTYSILISILLLHFCEIILSLVTTGCFDSPWNEGHLLLFLISYIISYVKLCISKINISHGYQEFCGLLCLIFLLRVLVCYKGLAVIAVFLLYLVLVRNTGLLYLICNSKIQKTLNIESILGGGEFGCMPHLTWGYLWLLFFPLHVNIKIFDYREWPHPC